MTFWNKLQPSFIYVVIPLLLWWMWMGCHKNWLSYRWIVLEQLQVSVLCLIPISLLQSFHILVLQFVQASNRIVHMGIRMCLPCVKMRQPSRLLNEQRSLQPLPTATCRILRPVLHSSSINHTITLLRRLDRIDCCLYYGWQQMKGHGSATRFPHGRDNGLLDALLR